MEHQGNRVEFDLAEVETYTVNDDQLVVTLKGDAKTFFEQVDEVRGLVDEANEEEPGYFEDDDLDEDDVHKK